MGDQTPSALNISELVGGSKPASPLVQPALKSIIFSIPLMKGAGQGMSQLRLSAAGNTIVSNTISWLVGPRQSSLSFHLNLLLCNF